MNWYDFSSAEWKKVSWGTEDSPRIKYEKEVGKDAFLTIYDRYLDREYRGADCEHNYELYFYFRRYPRKYNELIDEAIYQSDCLDESKEFLDSWFVSKKEILEKIIGDLKLN